MLQCQILELENNGMMLKFTVIHLEDRGVMNKPVDGHDDRTDQLHLVSVYRPGDHRAQRRQIWGGDV